MSTCRVRPRSPRRGPRQPLFLTLKSDLSLAVGNDTLPREAFGAALDGRTGATRRPASSCAPTRRVGYGELMEVMNLLRSAGYLKIALVGLETVPPGRGGRRNAP